MRPLKFDGKTEKSTEQELVLRLFDKDEGALLSVRKQYEPYLRGILRNFTENPSDIEECLNDVFFKLWNSIPPNKPSNLKAYLAKIARNTALDKVRRSGRRKRKHFETPLEEEYTGNRESAGDYFDEIEFKDLLERFLEAMPDRERNIFIFRFFYGDETETIAEMYGLSVSRTYRIISGLVRDFREYLKKEGVPI